MEISLNATFFICRGKSHNLNFQGIIKQKRLVYIPLMQTINFIKLHTLSLILENLIETLINLLLRLTISYLVNRQTLANGGISGFFLFWFCYDLPPMYGSLTTLPLEIYCHTLKEKVVRAFQGCPIGPKSFFNFEKNQISHGLSFRIAPLGVVHKLR